ncbi:hypothetical protein BT93_K1417 [Corymbia citriodora subsp. variegata]|nr:hypothetical protein BT93_K1417 [Corymbia citriodora subsp. variegata]
MSFSVSLPPQTPKPLQDPSPSPPPSSWLRVFALLRRFLRAKTARKPPKQFGPISVSASHGRIDDEGHAPPGAPSATEDGSAALQRAVKSVHFGSTEERRAAAAEIARLAREDARAKKLMAELGVVQALVAMVRVNGDRAQRGAIRALIELADGNHTNKALMVEAGIFLTLPSSKDAVDEETRHEFTDLLLSLSSLKNAHLLPPLESSRIVPFALSALESSGSSHDTKDSCLGVLYNLSAVLENASKLASNGVAEPLLTATSASKGLAEKALATLANLVVTSQGKRALEDSPMVPESLIEVLTWEDQPKCQELSAHILMILAYQSAAQRSKMARSGIVQVLLEVALLGSALAQKRALKMLQWFKDERQTKMGPHSGPQVARTPMGSPVHYRGAQEGRKMMRRLVKESLHKNMEMITRRAGGDAPSSPSGLKTLVISTSSKSLPY